MSKFRLTMARRQGELKAKVNITVAGASKAAVEAVEKAGGSVTVVTKAPAGESAPDSK